jgi:hypothetical protein
MLGFLGIGIALIVLGLWKIQGGQWPLGGGVSLGWLFVGWGSVGGCRGWRPLAARDLVSECRPSRSNASRILQDTLLPVDRHRSITVTGVGTNKRVMVVFAGAGQSLRTRVFSPGLYGTTVEQLLDVLTTYRERHATV